MALTTTRTALTTTRTAIESSAVVPRRRIAYFGLAREKHCMNCGRMIMEEIDLYSRRFCSLQCKEEYCSPVKSIVKTV